MTMVESDNRLISNYAINKLGSVLFQIENRELQKRRKKSDDIFTSVPVGAIPGTTGTYKGI